MYLLRGFRDTSLLHWPYCDRSHSTAHSWRLLHLVAYWFHHDPNRQLQRQQWAHVVQKIMSNESFKLAGKVGWYILLPLAFALVPTSWFESRPSTCLIRRVFGVRCPGCGMSRAISCVFHAELKKAFQYNRLVVVVFPLLCYIWLKGLMVECSQYYGDCLFHAEIWPSSEGR